MTSSLRLRVSPSSFLVVGLGGRILTNKYLIQTTLGDTIPLTGCFLGSLLFWIAERGYPSSQPQAAFALSGIILAVRILLDALISYGHGSCLLFWTLVGGCISAAFTVALLSRKCKEWALRVTRRIPKKEEVTSSVQAPPDSPPSYDSLSPLPATTHPYRWQSPALSRMLEEVLQVMDNVTNNQTQAPAAPPSTVSNVNNSPPPSSEFTSPQCVACGDPIHVLGGGAVVALACTHTYDAGCMLDMFLANLSSQVFPPLCCKLPIPLALIRPHVSADVYTMMQEKEHELSTADRLYCANPACSRFLGPRRRTPDSTSRRDGADAFAETCPACSTKTCARCGGPGHRYDTKRCKVDNGLKKALLLGQARGWQRCPGCRAVVERSTGCAHISCRCGVHFCYGCGELMKECKCGGVTGKKKRKDYLLLDEPAATKVDKVGKVKGVSGSVLVRLCKKSWGGVKGIIGGTRR